MMMNNSRFAEVYDKYYNHIWHICIMYMKNKQDAKDALQETFIKYYISNIFFKYEYKEQKWLLTTAGNICKNMLKKQHRKDNPIEYFKNESEHNQQHMDKTLDLVLNLPYKYKIPVYLYYYMDYDSSEIASIMKKPTSTIKNYLKSDFMTHENFKESFNSQTPTLEDKERMFEEITKKIPNQSKFKRFMYNMYGIKRVSVPLAALCIIIVVTSITSYAIDNSIMDFFFPKEEALLMLKDRQQIVINNGKESPNTIEENQESDSVKDNHHFSGNRKEHRNINKKINDEVKKFTGEINPEAEVFLNENGIFDDEILAMFTEEQIDAFEEEGLDNLQVYTSYLAVNDSEDLSDQPVDCNEMIALSDEQVDTYIAQKYYDDTDLNEEGHLSESSGGNADIKSPALLKRVVVAAQAKRGAIIHLSITYTWTEMPKYRGLDAIAIHWNYATWLSWEPYGTVIARHFWTYDTHEWIDNKTNKPTTITAGSGSINLSKASFSGLKKEQFDVGLEFLFAAIDLHDENEGGVFNSDANYTLVYYKTEGVSFDFYVDPDGIDYPLIIFWSDYYHLLTKSSVITWY